MVFCLILITKNEKIVFIWQKENRTIMSLKNKIISGLMSFLLISGFGTAAVSAAPNYTAIHGSNLELTKYLIMDANASVPQATFTFQTTPGTGAAATATTPIVFPGTGTIPDATVSFTSSDTTTAGSANDPVTTDTTKKYATKTFNINFANATFTEPGIYRYEVDEVPMMGTPYSYDLTTKIVDIYVVDNNGTLEVGRYVVYNSGSSSDTKSTSFTNSLNSFDLTVQKQVTGNQGSKDQYFKFTVEFSAIPEGTVISVDMSNAETAPVPTASTSYSAATMATANNVSSLTVPTGEVEISHDFYLKHGQSIVFSGLPKLTYYTVSEVHETGYQVTGEVTSTQLISDETVTITNTKNGTVPTGVIMKILPYAGLFALAAAALYFNKKGAKN